MEVRFDSVYKSFEKHKATSVWARKPGKPTEATSPSYVVRDVTFSLSPGEAMAYVGPNGAGKSTTIKLLLGLLKPSKGQISINGLDPAIHRKKIARRIGVLFGQRSQLWAELPALDTFELHRRLYGIPGAQFREQVESSIDMLEMGGYIDRPVRSLSLGERMRAELALCMLHRPSLIVLDEPTIGLDFIVKERIRAYLKSLVDSRRIALVLTSHDLMDVEELSTSIIIIDRGNVLFSGTLDEFRRRVVCNKRLMIRLETNRSNVQRPCMENHVSYHESASDIGDAISAIRTEGRITDLVVEDISLEKLVKALLERAKVR